jgi:hypothetical protein
VLAFGLGAKTIYCEEIIWGDKVRLGDWEIGRMEEWKIGRMKD